MSAETDRKKLRRLGYTVKIKQTGAEYPNCIPMMHGWQLILEHPNHPPRAFTEASHAWLFAKRCSKMLA